MGHSARPKNVSYFASAFGDTLAEAGADVDVEAGLAATSDAL
jgi:alanine-glyoxylate transaminase/serine-glyoxylate transaminase/serine-pyruvate transaminase